MLYDVIAQMVYREAADHDHGCPLEDDVITEQATSGGVAANFREAPIWVCENIKPLLSEIQSVLFQSTPHRLLAFSQNVRPGEGSGPTGPTPGRLQSLMTSRAEKDTQDLMR